MNIKTIVIAGAQEDIKITRTDAGATVSVERFTRSAGKHDQVIAEVGRDEDRDARYAKAVEVAKAVYGTDRRHQLDGPRRAQRDRACRGLLTPTTPTRRRGELRQPRFAAATCGGISHP